MREDLSSEGLFACEETGASYVFVRVLLKAGFSPSATLQEILRICFYCAPADGGRFKHNAGSNV